MFTWVLAGALALGAPALKDERKPVKPPEGEWEVVRLEISGHAVVRSDDPVKFYARITPTTVRVLRGDGSPVGTDRAVWFRVGERLEADFRWDDPTEAKKAIWKVEGDTLTICAGWPGDPRPTEYTSPSESGRILWVFKRKGG